MLEIKDATLVVGGQMMLSDCSFMANKGCITAVFGQDSCTLTVLLRAFLSLQPLQAGYVSVDGEQITPLSASTFRQMIAYVPCKFNFENSTVADVFGAVCGKWYHVKSEQEMQLLLEWKRLSVERSYYNKVLTLLPLDVQQRIMLSMATLLDRDVVLLDQPMAMQTEESMACVASYIQAMKSADRVVCFTTTNPQVAQMADTIVNITM